MKDPMESQCTILFVNFIIKIDRRDPKDCKESLYSHISRFPDVFAAKGKSEWIATMVLTAHFLAVVSIRSVFSDGFFSDPPFFDGNQLGWIYEMFSKISKKVFKNPHSRIICFGGALRNARTHERRIYTIEMYIKELAGEIDK